MIEVPEPALAYGFRNEPTGTHGSVTIMLAELRALLAAVPGEASYDDFKAAVLDDNALGKRTLATRQGSLRRLRELYALSDDVVLFRALRDLWASDPAAQPLLALLCAAARDPLLRASADLVLDLPPDEPVTPHQISDATAAAFPGRYNATTLANVGRHAASSWQQSGHLAGRNRKTRARAEGRPESVAYALLLGRLCGAGGAGLFSTFWARLLDVTEVTLRDQAAEAARLGWIEYRSAGGVTEVGFAHLLRGEELP